MMDYGKIINRSFEIAWKYKSLWIFGVFAGSGYSNFYINTGKKMNMDPYFPSDLQNFHFPTELLGMFVLAILGMAVIFMVLNILARGAIIDSTNKIQRGGLYRFSDAFSTGLDYFLRLFILLIIAVLSFLALVFVLVIIGIVAFAIHVALGVLSLLALIPAFLFGVFFFASVFNVAERVVVVRNTSITSALEEAYILFKRHIGKMALMFLISIAFAIALAIGLAMVWAIFGMPFAAIGLMADMSPLAALLIGILAGLPITIVLGGLVGVFYENLYTLFYFELVEPGAVAPEAVAPSQPQPLT
ncbi:MAG: hypothetical protein AB1483_02700 [Candidatus Zixiibacteriota bacterium]